MRQYTYDPKTLSGRIKLRAWELDLPLTVLSKRLGLRPDTLRARLSASRGKRAMQPHQITRIAEILGIPEQELHQMAARHEGWKV